MPTLNLTDLDEIVMTVRDKLSRSYISEAINAYRGGAYRSAIISTWIAVSSDVIAKIRELANQADANAKSFISHLDNAITTNNISQLQKIESGLLEKARDDFEFLSKHEYNELDRLRSDRNLCAHPAFIDQDTLFQPTPELVRAHIVHATAHLLQHQPVQGKSAIARIINDISQVSFPTNISDVTTFLREKYLCRSKDALIRNLISVLLKALLRKDITFLVGREQAILHTLVAISLEKTAIYEKEAPKILEGITASLDDPQLSVIFLLLKEEERAWKWLDVPTQLRVKSVIKNSQYGDLAKQGALDMLQVEELRSLLEEKIVSAVQLTKEFPLTKQLATLKAYPRPEFSDIAVNLYSSARSFRDAENLGSIVLIPMSHHFSPQHICSVLTMAAENNQIYDAADSPKILFTFFQKTFSHLSETKECWATFIRTLPFKIQSNYREIKEKLTEQGITFASEPELKIEDSDVPF